MLEISKSLEPHDTNSLAVRDRKTWDLCPKIWVS